MKKLLLFIHSAGTQEPPEGSSGLVAHLRDALGPYYEVLNPMMPDPEEPQYARWKASLETELAALNGEVILAGHSLGGSVLLKYLSEETYEKPIAGLFVIASPYWRKAGWQVDQFVLRDDFASTLHAIPQIFLYHSHDDDEVPFAHLAHYAEKLPDAVVRELNGYGHLFSEGLPELADDIRSL